MVITMAIMMVTGPGAAIMEDTITMAAGIIITIIIMATGGHLDIVMEVQMDAAVPVLVVLFQAKG
jgi:hypothetical protein